MSEETKDQEYVSESQVESLFSLFTDTEEELAKKWKCSRSTITRKKHKIRKAANKMLSTVIGGDYTVFFKMLVGRSASRSDALEEMQNNLTDPQEKLDVMKGAREEDIHFLKILKEGPVADALEKLGGRQDE
ncbi:MAG: hypothetical protein WAN47_09545 [Nitrosotalea sp.]